MDIVEAAIAHLKATVSVLTNHVAGSVELEDAIANTKFNAPAAFVLVLGESAAPNELVNRISQRVTLTFGVILAVPNGINTIAPSSAVVKNKLPIYRTPVMDAMLGWQAGPDYDPAEYLRGKLVSVQGKVLWWQDEYKTEFYIRK
jgi:hypothetical protein